MKRKISRACSKQTRELKEVALTHYRKSRSFWFQTLTHNRHGSESP
jgi:hypothetical protein